MDLSQIVIILARPMDSRNIGASMRAMANNAIEHLRIVGNKADYDKNNINRLSVHAIRLWEEATFHSSIIEATKDCSIVCATTRRQGKNRKRLYYPWELVEFIKDIKGPKAIVFGNERTGLDDKEIAQCNIGVTIPSAESFGSLNLSHAVQVICYEIYKGYLSYSGIKESVEAVDNRRLIAGSTKICDNLKALGFFTKMDEGVMIDFWTRLLARSGITEGELAYAERVFTKIRGLIEHPKNTK